MSKIINILWLLIIVVTIAGCVNSKIPRKSFDFQKNDITSGSHIEEKNLVGYFLFYRDTLVQTDPDVTWSKEIYTVFFVKQIDSILGDFLNFSDTLLIDSARYLGVTPIFGGYWNSKKNEHDSILADLIKRYGFQALNNYNFHSLIGSTVPKELIGSQRAFVAIFAGTIYTIGTFPAEFDFIRDTDGIRTRGKTYLLLNAPGNNLTYKLSIQF